jgi:hypothetical protein
VLCACLAAFGCKLFHSHNLFHVSFNEHMNTVLVMIIVRYSSNVVGLIEKRWTVDHQIGDALGASTLRGRRVTFWAARLLRSLV